MIKNLKKKAFTLVELLVVIAILAILATAGIVGYTSFTKKAQVSNDNSLVAELNNYISVATVDNDFNTVSEVRDELVPSGIDLSTLTPSAKNHGYSYAFNLKEEKFVLLNGTELAEGYSLANETKSWDVFVLVNSEEKANTYWNAGYSVYLQKGEYDGSLEAKAGVDVGENINITSINYTNTAAAQNVVIRTNSYTTNVTVNTAGSVQHYGNVGKLKIDKVAMASFHEFGKVRTVEIKEGNFVVEPKAVVTLVSVTAEAAGQVKIAVQSQGTLNVVAGDADKYEAPSLPANTETVDAPIEDNTLAIVDNVAKTTLSDSDFADGKKVVLLKDYETAVNLGSCEVVGNLVKFRANITGNKNITLKNIHSTGLFVSEFTGSLILDGGMLEYDSSLLANNEKAAIYINTGYGAYTFKNMIIAANTNKGIKISKAASVTVDNCEFDATNLRDDGSVDDHARSLSAIDIQEQNNAVAVQGAMTVSITNCLFKDIPQGTIEGGVADSDTAGAIKIKTEKAARSGGFAKVTISGNNFVNCYRDVVVGCNVYSNNTSTKEQADMDAPGNVVQSPTWEITNNKTTLTAAIIADRATLTYSNRSDKTQSIAEKVGSLKGGCGVWETANSARSWLS